MKFLRDTVIECGRVNIPIGNVFGQAQQFPYARASVQLPALFTLQKNLLLGAYRFALGVLIERISDDVNISAALNEIPNR